LGVRSRFLGLRWGLRAGFHRLFEFFKVPDAAPLGAFFGPDGRFPAVGGLPGPWKLAPQTPAFGLENRVYPQVLRGRQQKPKRDFPRGRAGDGSSKDGAKGHPRPIPGKPSGAGISCQGPGVYFPGAKGRFLSFAHLHLLVGIRIPLRLSALLPWRPVVRGGFGGRGGCLLHGGPRGGGPGAPRLDQIGGWRDLRFLRAVFGDDHAKGRFGGGRPGLLSFSVSGANGGPTPGFWPGWNRFFACARERKKENKAACLQGC